MPVAPEAELAMNDFRAIEQIFTGDIHGVKRQDSITKVDLDAYKYTFRSFGEYSRSPTNNDNIIMKNVGEMQM